MTTPVRLIVGLGNPGSEYAQTRHNAGARLVEALALGHGAPLRHDKRFFGALARVGIAAHEVRLLIPSTYMNRSGQAVAAVATFFKLQVSEILVAHDELDLPAGVARLKRSGGHGGHNGLRSIIQHLGNERDFLRLRLGIGHPGSAEAVTGYVLSKAPAIEEQALLGAIDECLTVMPQIVAGDMAGAMNQLHSRQSISP